MTQRKWVRGKALEMVFVLDAIQVGDELKIEPCAARGDMVDPLGLHPLVVTEVSRLDITIDPAYCAKIGDRWYRGYLASEPEPVRARGRWGVAMISEIVAWRPKRG